MEKKWIIKIEDGATIYGVKNSVSEKVSSAIFIVHGLTGHMYEYAFKSAADFFEADYDVYRFNLYDGSPGGRRLIDCTLSTHAADLNAVLKNFAGKYKRVFLIGHSYGGPTVMLANPTKITAVSLWDPSYDLKRRQKKFLDAYAEKENFYIVNWGTSYLMGKPMYEQVGRMDADFCAELSAQFLSPIQVIHADGGVYINDKDSYDTFCKFDHDRKVVSGTAPGHHP